LDYRSRLGAIKVLTFKTHVHYPGRPGKPMPEVAGKWEGQLSIGLEGVELARSGSLDSSSTLGDCSRSDTTFQVSPANHQQQMVRHVLRISSHLFARIPHIKAMRFLLFLTRPLMPSFLIGRILHKREHPKK